MILSCRSPDRRDDGREQVRRAHAALHRASMFADTRVRELSLDLRPLVPDVVVGISRTATDGAGPTPDGRPYPPGGSVMTLLFRHDGDTRRIAHAHNTTVDAAAAAHDPTAAPAGAG